MTMTTSFVDDDSSIDTQPVYTYLLTDLRNNAIIGELDFMEVSYSNVLSGIGEFSGSVSLNLDTMNYSYDSTDEYQRHTDRSRPTLNIRSITSPGKTGIYVLRNGVIVWGGILWKRAYDSSAKKLNVTGKTFESYFYHRFQRTTKYWAQEEQLNIARWLVTSNNSASDLGITVSDSVSTRFRERTMYGYEFKTTGEELEQLSNLIDGFDWNIVLGKDTNGYPTRHLEFYYPNAGVSKDSTTLFFDYPGSVKRFSMTEDSENACNILWAIGAGEGTEMVYVSSSSFSQLSSGWPILELSRSHKSVLRPSTLQGHADSEVERLASPITVMDISVRADLDPQLGTYDLGDWANFRLEDDYFNVGTNDVLGLPVYDFYARITAIGVSVNTASGIEEVKLTLGGDEMREEEETNDY